MGRAIPPTAEASAVAAYNWRQRAKQLSAIAKAMGDTPAAAVLRERAAEYLRRADVGELHRKRGSPERGGNHP
jgi:hypothetical protein